VPLFALRIASLEREARYTLTELFATSKSSIVSLDTPVDSPSPVLLRIAGKESGATEATPTNEMISSFPLGGLCDLARDLRYPPD
jgi:hypothetical protein